MIKFLRKHQRLLFLIIAIMTIASFSFFGTVTTLMSEQRPPDRQIAKSIDGSPIMEQEVRSMVQFFSLGNRTPIESDFLTTGLGAILAERYFDTIQEEFSTRLEKAKRYQPYRHPQFPLISAEEAWKRFLPQMRDHLAQVKAGTPSPETFNLYTRLYLDQVAFTPEILRRVLSYEQNRYPGVQPDPAIETSRLALFGFQSLEEWFGTNYLEKISLFLINTSKIAEEKGYAISSEEAHADLMQSALETLQNLSGKKELTYVDAEQFLNYQLKNAGIDMPTGIKVWKKVMLFRRLFDDVGSAVFVDPLSYEQFAVFAGESAHLELYELPSYLQLRDFRSLLKLQFYLDAVALRPKGLKLPTTFLSPQEVERKHPELVHTLFSLEVAKTSQEEMSQRVSLKETWDWEVTDAGWAILSKEFPILRKSESENHFKLLEELSPDLRLKVDRFARHQIVALHPEWLQEAFDKAPLEKVTVSVRSKGAAAPFTEIEETAPLLEFLKQNDQGVFVHQGETFYKIIVLEREDKKSVMTFEEALKDNLLGTLLDRHLKAEKDTDGKRCYADLLRAITPKEVDLHEYVRGRLLPFMEEAKRSVQEVGDTSPFLKKSGDLLKDQWLLTQRQTTIQRSSKTLFAKEEAFALDTESWSKVEAGEQGAVTFFRLLDRKVQEADSIAEEVDLGQKILGMDARRLLMHQLLDTMEKR
jgi:GcvH upstream region-like protein